MAAPRFILSRFVPSEIGNSMCTCDDYPGGDRESVAILRSSFDRCDASNFKLAVATVLYYAGFAEIANRISLLARERLYQELEEMKIADAVIWYAVRAVKSAAVESIFPLWKDTKPPHRVAVVSAFRRRDHAAVGAAEPAADAAIKSISGPRDIVKPYTIDGRKLNLNTEPADASDLNTEPASAASTKIAASAVSAKIAASAVSAKITASVKSAASAAASAAAPAVSAAAPAASAAASAAAPAALNHISCSNNQLASLSEGLGRSAASTASAASTKSPRHEPHFDSSEAVHAALTRDRYVDSGFKNGDYRKLAKSLLDSQSADLLGALRKILTLHDAGSGPHGMKYMRNFTIVMPKDTFVLTLDTMRVPPVYVFHALYGGVDPDTPGLKCELFSGAGAIADELFPEW